MRNCAWLAALALVGAFSLQEPAKGRQEPVKEPAKQTEPVSEPAEATEPIGAPVRDPIEGLYTLRARMAGGVQALGSGEGYVAITHRHLLMVLAGGGTDPERPLLRAGVRKWQRAEKGISMTAELGFFTDADGDIYLEKPGEKSVRKIDLARGRLRIWQDAESYLEFERVE